MLSRLFSFPIEYVDGLLRENKVYGWFVYADKPKIQIESSLNEPTKTWVKYHEIGHLRCFLKNCYCIRRHHSSTIQREICESHANLFAAKYLWNHGHMDGLEGLIRHIYNTSDNCRHTKFMKNICKFFHDGVIVSDENGCKTTFSVSLTEVYRYRWI